MKRLVLLTALVTLAASPAVADRLFVDTFVASSNGGAGAGPPFLICDYGIGGRQKFDEPPCGSTGTPILTFSPKLFLEYQFPIDVPSNQDSIAFWNITNDTSISGSFVLIDAPSPPPPSTPAMPDDQKKRFAHWSNYVGILSAATAFAATVFVAVGNAAAATALGTSSALLYILSSVLNDISVDPIDDNYAVIATPIPYPLPDLSGGGTCAENIGNGLSLTIALAQAVTTSYNRMQGALVAGDAYWTQQQAQAMVNYANQLDNELSNIDPAQLFGCAPERQLTSAAAALSFEMNLSTNGMHAFLTSAYNSTGITGSFALYQANGFLYVQDPELVAEGYNAIFGPKSSRVMYWQALGNDVP